MNFDNDDRDFLDSMKDAILEKVDDKTETLHKRITENRKELSKEIQELKVQGTTSDVRLNTVESSQHDHHELKEDAHGMETYVGKQLATHDRENHTFGAFVKLAVGVASLLTAAGGIWYIAQKAFAE